MLQRFGRFRLLSAFLAGVASLAIAGSALGVVPQSFRPDGHARFAFKGVDVSSPTTSTTDAFVDMAGMSVSIAIATGHTADVFITFSAELNGCGPIYVRAIVDSAATVAAPGAALHFSHTGGSAETHGFTWSKTVSGGPHVVKIQWQDVGGCSQAFAGVRSLYVMANVH